MKLRVTHRTTYRFGSPLRSLTQSLRLWPTQFEGQDVHEWSVGIAGTEAERGAAFRDGAGDWIETVAMRQVTEAVIAVEGVVETRDLNGVVKGLREKVPPLAYLRDTPRTALDQGLKDLAAEAEAEESGDLDRAHAICRRVHDRIAYATGATESATTAAEALARGEGVCQDHAHAIIASGRALGLPGRYVTGYLYADIRGDSHSASHAWAELWIEGLGWVGFDGANACCPDDRYVRIGSGLDAVDAAPIRGRAIGKAEEEMDVDVRVTEAGVQQ